MTAQYRNNEAEHPLLRLLLWILFWVCLVFAVGCLFLYYIQVDGLTFLTANLTRIAGIVLLAVSVILIIAALYALHRVRYAAVPAFFCLALLARAGGFAAAFFFPMFGMGAFWHLPFGDTGSLLFFLVTAGGLQLAGRVSPAPKQPVALSLLPVALYLAPAALLLLGYGAAGGIWPMLWPFIYVTPPVICLLPALRYGQAAGIKGMLPSLLLLAGIELLYLVYLLPIKVFIPDQLPQCLAPLGLILFTLHFTGHKEVSNG